MKMLLMAKALIFTNMKRVKKELYLVKQKISKIIRETVNSLNKLAETKSIKLTLDIQENIPDICIDKKEIKKVIFIFLENALTYTQKNGFVEIKTYQLKNSIITSIKKIMAWYYRRYREKMFQRYEMLKIIERKIRRD